MKRDVSGKKLQKRLLEKQDISRKITEDSPLAIYIFQEGKLEFFNQAFVELSGYSRDELSRIDYLSLIHPDFREPLVRQTEVAFTGGTSGLSQEPEIQVIRKNGEVRWVQIRPRIIEYHGKPAVLGMAADVTERKLAEDRLQESETRYRLLAESLSDVLWVVDTDAPNKITYVSPSITHLLGYTVEEAMYKKMEEVVTSASLDTVMSTFAKVLPVLDREKDHQHESLVLELELIRKDGSIVPVEVKFSLVKETQGQSPSILALARDTSERKELEAERLNIEQKAQWASRMAAIGEMAAGVAHEINNPLTSVIGFCDLLLKKEVPENMRRDLEIICEGARRTASIVKRLSVFARQSRPLRRRIDINEVVENTLKLRDYRLRTSGIEVETSLDPDLPETLADGGQMGEVFLNIIANAETEMNSAHGKGILRVTTRKRDGNIQISFQDDGPGISAENMQKLFRPFFTTKPVGQGAGLGLSFSFGIIAEHGGRIWAESEFGKGATFFVEIPISRKRELVGEQGHDRKDSAKTLPARVLVIDDETTVQEYLSQVLTDWGHKVDVAEDGYQALSMIKNCNYDVILMDIKMPSMSGIELYERFKEADDKSLGARVILVTGDVLGAETGAFLSQNKVPVIAKPIDVIDLNSKISAILTSLRRRRS